jgi:hypothetical protein
LLILYLSKSLKVTTIAVEVKIARIKYNMS